MQSATLLSYRTISFIITPMSNKCIGLIGVYLNFEIWLYSNMIGLLSKELCYKHYLDTVWVGDLTSLPLMATAASILGNPMTVPVVAQNGLAQCCPTGGP
ncbi:hypothetical protein XELAEV_18014758mg [Xenopus laevis]|uniref:Uncharacterized protein n=1 Tax=Xenopus laevis TaxID=8355 RepID=A0A974HVA0_XENLA|nr:hypothetical protein XELAEV_18014758mg [Xenopus laevis]